MQSRVFNKIISKTGEEVTVRPRISTVDELGGVNYTFPEALWFRTRVLKYDASGLREDWYVIGTDEQVDYVLSTYGKLDGQLNIHDLIELRNGELVEIVIIIRRGRGPIVDHLEILSRRVDILG